MHNTYGIPFYTLSGSQIDSLRGKQRLGTKEVVFEAIGSSDTTDPGIKT